MRFQTLATAATLLTAIGASVIRRREIADGAKVTLIAEGEDCKLKLDNMQGCTGTSDPVGKVQDNRCIGTSDERRATRLHTAQGERSTANTFFLCRRRDEAHQGLQWVDWDPLRQISGRPEPRGHP